VGDVLRHCPELPCERVYHLRLRPWPVVGRLACGLPHVAAGRSDGSGAGRFGGPGSGGAYGAHPGRGDAAQRHGNAQHAHSGPILPAARPRPQPAPARQARGFRGLPTPVRSPRAGTGRRSRPGCRLQADRRLRTGCRLGRKPSRAARPRGPSGMPHRNRPSSGPGASSASAPPWPIPSCSRARRPAGTANTHMRHIYRKLDVHSQHELINLVESMEVE